MKNKLRFLLSKKNTIDILIGLLLFHFILINLPWIPIYNILKYATLCIVGIYILLNFRILIKKNKYLVFNILAILMGCILMFSSYLNKDNYVRNTFLASIVTVGLFLESIFYFEIILHKSKTFELINCWGILSLIYSCLVTASIFLLGENASISGDYLVGDKFHVSYLNLFTLIVWWFILKKKNCSYKMKLFMGILLFIITSFLINSSTGVVAFILLLFLLLLEKYLTKIISNPLFFLLIFVLSATFVFTYDLLDNFELVKFFIVDFLGKDLTLTSRVYIYHKLPKIIYDNFLIGTGYGSTYEFMMDYAGAPNTQNGFFEIFLQGGIFYILLYTLFILFTYIGVKRKNFKYIYPLYVYSAIIIILSSIEITYDLNFVSLLFIFYIIGTMDNVVTNNKVGVVI